VPKVAEKLILIFFFISFVMHESRSSDVIAGQCEAAFQAAVPYTRAAEAAVALLKNHLGVFEGESAPTGEEAKSHRKEFHNDIQRHAWELIVQDAKLHFEDQVNAIFQGFRELASLEVKARVGAVRKIDFWLKRAEEDGSGEGLPEPLKNLSPIISKVPIHREEAEVFYSLVNLNSLRAFTQPAYIEELTQRGSDSSLRLNLSFSAAVKFTKPGYVDSLIAVPKLERDFLSSRSFLSARSPTGRRAFSDLLNEFVYTSKDSLYTFDEENRAFVLNQNHKLVTKRKRNTVPAAKAMKQIVFYKEQLERVGDIEKDASNKVSILKEVVAVFEAAVIRKKGDAEPDVTSYMPRSLKKPTQKEGQEGEQVDYEKLYDDQLLNVNIQRLKDSLGRKIADLERKYKLLKPEVTDFSDFGQVEFESEFSNYIYEKHTFPWVRKKFRLLFELLYKRLGEFANERSRGLVRDEILDLSSKLITIEEFYKLVGVTDLLPEIDRLVAEYELPDLLSIDQACGLLFSLLEYESPTNYLQWLDDKEAAQKRARIKKSRNKVSFSGSLSEVKWKGAIPSLEFQKLGVVLTGDSMATLFLRPKAHMSKLGMNYVPLHGEGTEHSNNLSWLFIATKHAKGGVTRFRADEGGGIATLVKNNLVAPDRIGTGPGLSRPEGYTPAVEAAYLELLFARVRDDSMGLYKSNEEVVKVPNISLGRSAGSTAQLMHIYHFDPKSPVGVYISTAFSNPATIETQLQQTMHRVSLNPDYRVDLDALEAIKKLYTEFVTELSEMEDYQAVAFDLGQLMMLHLLGESDHDGGPNVIDDHLEFFEPYAFSNTYVVRDPLKDTKFASDQYHGNTDAESFINRQKLMEGGHFLLTIQGNASANQVLQMFPGLPMELWPRLENQNVEMQAATYAFMDMLITLLPELAAKIDQLQGSGDPIAQHKLQLLIDYRQKIEDLKDYRTQAIAAEELDSMGVEKREKFMNSMGFEGTAKLENVEIGFLESYMASSKLDFYRGWRNSDCNEFYNAQALVSTEYVAAGEPREGFEHSRAGEQLNPKDYSFRDLQCRVFRVKEFFKARKLALADVIDNF